MPFRKPYNRRDGTRAKTKVYYTSVYLPGGETKHINLRVGDKRAAERIEMAVRNVVDRTRAGLDPDQRDMDLLTLPAAHPRLPEALLSCGVLKQEWVRSSLELAALLEEYAAYQRDGKVSDKRIETVLKECRTVFDALRWKYPSEINQDKYIAWMNRRRGRGESVLSQGTMNQYVARFHGFVAWLVSERVLHDKPIDYGATLEKIRRANRQRAKRRYRHKVLTRRQYEKLVLGTRRLLAGSDNWPIPPRDRSLLYALAVQTGMRGNTLRQLRAEDFAFTDEGMKVSVDGSRTKNGQSHEVWVVDKTIIGWTRERLHLMAGPTRLFHNAPEKMAPMIRSDCERVGIDWGKGQVKRVAFHSLKHTMVSLMLEARVPKVVVMHRAQHSDLLTTNRYVDVTEDEQLIASRALPSLPQTA